MAKQSNSKPADTTENALPFNVYVVDDSEKVKARYPKGLWTRVGTAFKHDDEQGFNLVLVPGIAVSGRLVIRERKPKDAGGDED